MISCYHCVNRLSFPHCAVSVIGADKKEFKKDFFDFCPDCFEYLFGIVTFSSKKTVAMSCHVCQSNVIESLPYSYFLHWYKIDNQAGIGTGIGRRRVCGTCSKRELFPIINSLLIVKP